MQKEFRAGYQYPGKAEAYSYDFGTLCDWASRKTIYSIVPTNDQRFLAPDSMIAEVQKACRESGQEVPVTPWEISRVIYQSLAACYREAFREIEELTGRTYDTVHIVGGGAKAVWLDELTAIMSRRIVLAGPYEATAIGNLGAQMIKDGIFTDLMDFRKCVAKSFEIRKYKN